MIKCHRGDVVVVDLGFKGKVRPCVVVSIDDADKARNLTVVVPITSEIRNTAWEIDFGHPKWSRQASVANLTGIAGVENHQIVHWIGNFPKDAMEKVSDGLYWLLGLEDSSRQAPA